MNGNSWRETAWLLEGHTNPLYCVSFNFFGKDHRNIFASCGSNRATVYRCEPDGELEPLQVFTDEDAEEDFYVCCWSVDIATGAPLLLLGGKNAVLKVINCATGVLETSLEGHGMSINDISVHPTRPQLVVTSSKDHSMRLWNLRTKACVLIFQGDGGHRNEVLSADWQPGGGLVLVSAGLDSCVKVWDLEPLEECLNASEEWNPESGVAFPTKHVTVPSFSTRVVHFSYVDCVRWLGEFLLSKSVDNQIVCWKPQDGWPPSAAEAAALAALGQGPRGRHLRDGAVQHIQEFQLEDCKAVWWLRFALDYKKNILAAGTAQGKVLVYDPHELEKNPVAKLRPARYSGRIEEGSKKAVRQTAVSYNGDIIIACHEDGSITRFDLKRRSGTGEQERKN